MRKLPVTRYIERRLESPDIEALLELLSAAQWYADLWFGTSTIGTAKWEDEQRVKKAIRKAKSLQRLRQDELPQE